MSRPWLLQSTAGVEKENSKDESLERKLKKKSSPFRNIIFSLLAAVSHLTVIKMRLILENFYSARSVDRKKNIYYLYLKFLHKNRLNAFIHAIFLKSKVKEAWALLFNLRNE